MGVLHFRSLLAILKAQWFAVLLWCLIGALVAAAINMAVPVAYNASARLFLATPNWNDNTASGHPDPRGQVTTYAFGDEFSQHRALSYAELVNTNRIATGVIDQLGLDATPDDVAGRLTARVIPDTVFVEITARAPTADDSAKMANAAADQMTKMIEELETPFKQISPPLIPLLIKPAVPPDAPSSPRLVVNLVSGILLGFLLGLTYAAVRERVKEVETPADLYVGDSTLGVFSGSDIPAFAALDDVSHAVAEDARYLCLRMKNALETSRPPKQTILFASPRETEDVGAAAVLVSAALSELGHRVALVLTNYAGAGAQAPREGLGEVLDGRAALDAVLRYDHSGNIGLVTAGTTRSSSIAANAGDAMTSVLNQLADMFDYVLVLGGPVLESADSLALAGKTGASLLVCPMPPTTGTEVAECERLLALAPSVYLGRAMAVDPAEPGAALSGTRSTSQHPEPKTTSQNG
jgi:capsular polysaccharide biosynthesis protein